MSRAAHPSARVTSLTSVEEQFDDATRLGAEKVSSGIVDTAELARTRSASVEREASSFSVVWEWWWRSPTIAL